MNSYRFEQLYVNIIMDEQYIEVVLDLEFDLDYRDVGVSVSYYIDVGWNVGEKKKVVLVNFYSLCYFNLLI